MHKTQQHGTYDHERAGHNAHQGVRPYMLTHGRTRPDHPLRLESVLQATGAAAAGPVEPEAAQAVALCRSQARSVAEIAALLQLPVPIVKIILSDLIRFGLLALAVPRTATGELDQRCVLEALLEGLRSLSDVA